MTSDTKKILDITKMSGQQFKNWTHKRIAAAIINGRAKTESQLLRSVYNELINSDDLPDISKFGLLLCGNKNKLDYLSNYQPNKEFVFDFIMFKAEFVRLMIEKAGF